MLIRRVLLNREDPRGGGGGKKKDDDTTDDDDNDDLEERIGKIVDARLNRVVSSHLKRELPKLADQLVERLKPQKGEDDDEDADDGKGKGRGKPAGTGDLPPEVDQRFKQFEKELAAEKAKREAAEKKTADMEAKRARSEEDDLLRKALGAAGLKDEVKVLAAFHLHRGEGRVKRDESGAILFVKRGEDGAEEEMPLAKGIADWAKTPEGKAFLPATGAAGSGAQGGRGAASQGGKVKNGADGKSAKYTDSDFADEIANAILGGGPSGS